MSGGWKRSSCLSLNPLNHAKGVISMKTKFCALLVGATLLAFASATDATELLSNNQMDAVTAGGNWAALAGAAAVAVGNFDAITFTATNTYTSQVENVAVAQSTASGAAASAITRSLLSVGSNAAATCTGTC